MKKIIILLCFFIFSSFADDYQIKSSELKTKFDKIIQKAVSEKKPDNCESISADARYKNLKELYKLKCFARLAVITKNIELCKKVSNKRKHSHCIKIFNKESNKQRFKDLNNEVIKITIEAVKAMNPNLCKNITAEEKYKDLIMRSKTECYSRVAHKAKNANFCKYITNANKKLKCEKYVKLGSRVTYGKLYTDKTRPKPRTIDPSKSRHAFERLGQYGKAIPIRTKQGFYHLKIADIVSGGFFDKKGFKEKDIIVAIEDKEIWHFNNLLNIKSFENVKFTVFRGNSIVNLNCKNCNRNKISKEEYLLSKKDILNPRKQEIEEKLRYLDSLKNCNPSIFTNKKSGSTTEIKGKRVGNCQVTMKLGTMMYKCDYSNKCIAALTSPEVYRNLKRRGNIEMKMPKICTCKIKIK